MELFATALFILVLVSLNDKAAETQNISSPFVPFVLGVVYAAAQMATVSCNSILRVQISIPLITLIFEWIFQILHKIAVPCCALLHVMHL